MTKLNILKKARRKKIYLYKKMANITYTVTATAYMLLIGKSYYKSVV